MNVVEIAGVSGVAHTTIYTYRRMAASPDDEKLKAISDATGVPLPDLRELAEAFDFDRWAEYQAARDQAHAKRVKLLQEVIIDAVDAELASRKPKSKRA